MSSHNKRATSATVGSDPGAAQDHMNVLYTAHQVHALAQIVYQKFTGSWTNQTPWGAPQMGAFHSFAGHGAASAPFTPGTMGTMGCGTAAGPMAPPALYYWYP